MKSSKEALGKRGYVDERMRMSLSHVPQETLLGLLDDVDPTVRTMASHAIVARQGNAAVYLLARLAIEPCLYTRIAICRSLADGDCTVARRMVGYLGRIGCNQYVALPDRVSEKRSFPLPRDIVARTLGTMSGDILPVLLAALQDGDRRLVREAVDAVGYLIARHPECSTVTVADTVCTLLVLHVDDELIVWKVLRCLSVLPFAQSLLVLRSHECDPSILGKEAKRSIRLLRREHFAIFS